MKQSRVYFGPSRNKSLSNFITKFLSSDLFYRLERNDQFYNFLKYSYWFVHRTKRNPFEFFLGYKTINQSETSTIYCDVTGVLNVPFIDGTRRVGKYFIDHLIKMQDINFRVLLVEWDGKTFVEFNETRKTLSQCLRRRSAWNPKESDFLFLQSMEAVTQIKESKFIELKEKVKILTFIHDILPILEPDWFTRRMVKNFKKNLEIVLNYSHLLIVSSRVVESNLKEITSLGIFLSKIPKIELVSISSVAKRFNSIEAIHKFTTFNKPLVFLLISTIEPRKGYDELVEAATRALNEGANLKFIVIGRVGWISDSFYSKFMEFNKAFSDRIIWHYNCTDEMVGNLLSEVDIFLSPTRGEGFGIPVTEALIAGLPTLARDIPVYRELYEDSVAFYGEGNEFPDLYSALVNSEKLYEIARAKAVKFPVNDSRESFNALMNVFRANLLENINSK